MEPWKPDAERGQTRLQLVTATRCVASSRQHTMHSQRVMIPKPWTLRHAFMFTRIFAVALTQYWRGGSAKKLPNAPAYGQTGGIVCPNGRNAMTDRSESRDIESDVEESGDAGRSSVDRTQSARPSPSELSSETDTTAIDLSGRQIGQVMMEALSRLFQTPNEETIIDAELAHKALDLDRHELDLINEEAKRDHQRKMQEIKVVASLAVAALIVILVICALVAWRAPDKLLEIVIPTITAIGGLLGGYGIGRARR